MKSILDTASKTGWREMCPTTRYPADDLLFQDYPWMRGYCGIYENSGELPIIGGPLGARPGNWAIVSSGRHVGRRMVLPLPVSPALVDLVATEEIWSHRFPDTDGAVYWITEVCGDWRAANQAMLERVANAIMGPCGELMNDLGQDYRYVGAVFVNEAGRKALWIRAFDAEAEHDAARALIKEREKEREGDS